LFDETALKESAVELDDGSAAVHSPSVARASPVGDAMVACSAGYHFGRWVSHKPGVCPGWLRHFRSCLRTSLSVVVSRCS
jgi:hypothetical protein